jgi:DsbC/DsbD-like thiol-disulfide interchange protein
MGAMQMFGAAIVSAAIAIGVLQEPPRQKALPQQKVLLQQKVLPEGGSHETAHLTIDTSASVDAAAPGQKVTLQVDVTPKPKMHVYAPGQDGYIPISLTLDADPAFTAAEGKFPAAEKYFMPALNETQLVYSKPFRVTQEVTLARTPALRERARQGAASLTIKGTVRYQACDDRICYLPANVPVEWTVKLSPAR